MKSLLLGLLILCSITAAKADTTRCGGQDAPAGARGIPHFDDILMSCVGEDDLAYNITIKETPMKCGGPVFVAEVEVVKLPEQMILKKSTYYHGSFSFFTDPSNKNNSFGSNVDGLQLNNCKMPVRGAISVGN